MRRSMPVIFSVTFVRHGETMANREHRIQGHLDIPLSSFGEKQATLAGKGLCKTNFTRVYASDLSRAYVTCERILQQNTCVTPPIKVDTRLRERNYGTVEGLKLEEAKTMAAAEGLTWPQYTPPGAENLGVLQERMVCFFKELCQSIYDKNKTSSCDAGDSDETEDICNTSLQENNAVETVLVVSHGAALKQLYLHIHKTLGCQFPGDPNVLQKLSPNTGISQYIVQLLSPKKLNLHCVRIHDDDHLQALS